MLTENRTYLDDLTRKLTAFADFNKFVTALQTGYVPTIFPRDYAGQPIRRQVILRKIVRAHGFRVWPDAD